MATNEEVWVYQLECSRMFFQPASNFIHKVLAFIRHVQSPQKSAHRSTFWYLANMKTMQYSEWISCHSIGERFPHRSHQVKKSVVLIINPVAMFTYPFQIILGDLSFGTVAWTYKCEFNPTFDLTPGLFWWPDPPGTMPTLVDDESIFWAFHKWGYP